MKKLFYLLLTAFAITSCTNTVVKEETAGVELRFKDGEFKIAQLADMHYGNREDRDTVGIRKMIESVMAEEKPDLIVLTGDNITDADSLEENEMLWKRMIGILEATDIPYAIVMGNHDAEACDSVNADWLEKWITEYSTRCVNYPTTSSCYGHGLRALEVLSEKNDSVAALVYTIDSNDYPQDPTFAEYSDYDWIHPDQIKWYEEQSRKYTAMNGGTPLPAVAYFHICVPEFDIVAHDSNRFGSFSEHCCPPDVNTGFFSSAMFHGDIMGMFVGHDHSNDYCGILDGIALCYGRQSGVGGDENTPMGSRIVVLKEGKREFDTWVRTPEAKGPQWYYPIGSNSTIIDDPMPATELAKAENGIRYTYFEGPESESCNDILVARNKKDEGVMPVIDITKAPAEDHFGYLFSGYFLAEETSPYCFAVMSDDGAMIYIDDKLVIDNDGSHSRETKKAYVGLEKGYHKFEVKYYEDYMGQQLTLRYADKTHGMQDIPARLLFH